jgi:L-threonylcarbamoyladenylate synthase
MKDRLLAAPNPSRPTLRHMIYDTETIAPTPDGLLRAVAVLRNGDLVAFPTETVYGLGGDARSDIAVARIFAAKDRPHFNPLIVHVPDLAAARAIAQFTDQALDIAAAFWPGPLTLVLPINPGANLSPLVTANLPTVAIRVPAHPVAQALLQSFGGPLAAPSANPSGRISPTRAQHVTDGLAGRIAAILDGGACSVGVESTILGLDGIPTLLRPGGIPVEAIEAMLGHALPFGGTADKPNAPGQLASHYAPIARLRLNASASAPDEIYIAFGPADRTLSASRDLIEAAANLFHVLREADLIAGPRGQIAIAPIPETGLGRAINDRLRRAAAPRH